MENWESIAADKRGRLSDSIPADWRIEKPSSEIAPLSYVQQCGLLSPEEIALTETTATELVQRMANGQLTSTAVTLAFCKRAALAQQLLNCAHEFFPEMALARAKELDQHYARTKTTVGPLHGLPVTLKDQCRIKGLETSMGYVAWIGKYDTEDSVLVSLLRSAGAVFYIKTSVPQSLMVCETVNNVVGRCVNPRGTSWTCGGSSGGEGALLGFRGAVMGVGTDIGGSIRVPAAFNSLFGLRPSHGRLPYAKMANSMEGQETVHSVCGPMCHTIPDMKLFMTSILAQKPWRYDSKVIPLAWRQEEEDIIKKKIENGGLTLGFYKCDGNVLPHPPVLRAVEEVVNRVSRAGHTIVPWEPFEHTSAVDLINRIYAADGGTDIFTTLAASGEPAIPNFADLINPSLPKMDITEVWQVQQQKWKYQCDYLQKINELEQAIGKEVDAIIAPITPTSAVRHNQFKYYGYASVINLLDFTSIAIPVTTVDKTIDVQNSSFTPLSDLDQQVQGEYDPAAYHGAPVGVQIIGRRLTEERIMAIASEISYLLSNVSN